MGMEGAALATGIGQVLPLAIYIAVLFYSPIPVKIRRSAMKADRKIDRQLYTVGIPAILNIALPSLMISALNTILSVYSQSYIVILGIYYKLQTFLYLPANGIIQGMRPVIGYNYGAGEGERVSKIYKVTLGMTAVIMAVGMVICLMVPEGLIGMFTENSQTVEAGGRALRIISAGFVEQYQRKSSLSSMKDADIQEIAEVFVDKRYAGKTIEEMEEEQNIKIFLVLRDDLSVLPQKNMDFEIK